MDKIRKLLKERGKYLCELKSEKEKELKTLPEDLLVTYETGKSSLKFYYKNVTFIKRYIFYDIISINKF